MGRRALFVAGWLIFPFLLVAEMPVKEIGRGQVLSAGEEWLEKYDSFKPDPGLIEDAIAILSK